MDLSDSTLHDKTVGSNIGDPATAFMLIVQRQTIYYSCSRKESTTDYFTLRSAVQRLLHTAVLGH